jgi:hypothetical protein
VKESVSCDSLWGPMHEQQAFEEKNDEGGT